MERLAREQGETAILTAPCGIEAIVLHTVEAEQHGPPLLRRLPARADAPRRLGQGRWPPASSPPSASGCSRRPATPGSQATLEQIRRRGWVRTSGELDPGVSAVAAPVLDARGRLLAGLSLAGPTARMADAGFEATAAAVCEAASTIEAALAARDQ